MTLLVTRALSGVYSVFDASGFRRTM